MGVVIVSDPCDILKLYFLYIYKWPVQGFMQVEIKGRRNDQQVEEYHRKHAKRIVSPCLSYRKNAQCTHEERALLTSEQHHNYFLH